jgi:hypothetical protein
MMGVGRLVGRLGAGQAAHLDAVAGIGHGILVGHLRQPQPLVAHPQARGVHHHEHRRQPLVRLAHQGARGAIQVDLAGRAAVDAHLVLDRGAEDGIAFAQAAVVPNLELRHHEQADALAAGGRFGQPGQHQVHDVGSQVVFTCADEDLLAGELVAAVGLRFGLGAQQAQVGAAVRFGQAHGAGPLATDHLGQVQGLLFRRAVFAQALVGTVRKPRVHGPGLVGRVEHLVEALVDHDRQALTTVLGVATQRRPATFHVLLVGPLETLRWTHLVRAGVQHAPVAIAADVEREHHFGGELAALFEHRVDRVGVDLGMARQALEFIGDLQQLVQDEVHVAQRWYVLGHRVLLR